MGPGLGIPGHVFRGFSSAHGSSSEKLHARLGTSRTSTPEVQGLSDSASVVTPLDTTPQNPSVRGAHSFPAHAGPTANDCETAAARARYQLNQPHQSEPLRSRQARLELMVREWVGCWPRSRARFEVETVSCSLGGGLVGPRPR